MFKSIAIDGPSGSGKSTISKGVAKKLDMVYVDTGAMFRTIALYLVNNNKDYDNENIVANLLDDIKIDFKYHNDKTIVLLNNNDVTSMIRTPDVSKVSSIIAKYKSVREKLVDIQREVAINNNVVMDGRDIGTVVLPNANLKIFLVADINIRAERRLKELIKKGVNTTLEEVITDLEIRDFNDKNRKIAPLKKAEDAVIVDSSNDSINNIVNKIIEEAKNKKCI